MQVSRFRLKPLVLFLATFWAGSVAATPIVKSASGDLISPYSVSLGGWYFHVTPSIAADGLDQNHDVGLLSPGGALLASTTITNTATAEANALSRGMDLTQNGGLDVSMEDTLGFSGGMDVPMEYTLGFSTWMDVSGTDSGDETDDPGFGPGPGVTEICHSGLGFSGGHDPFCEIPITHPPEATPEAALEAALEEPPGEPPGGPQEEPSNDVDAPPTLALFGLGLLGLGYSRQRRRKR